MTAGDYCKLNTGNTIKSKLDHSGVKLGNRNSSLESCVMRCQNYVTNASRRDSPEKQDKKGQNETFLKATA